jgi:hypothetical protein
VETPGSEARERRTALKTGDLPALLAAGANKATEAVLANPQAVAYAAREVSDEERAQLLDLLGELWPEDGFEALMAEDGQGEQARRGWAWIILGPVLKAPLTPKRWAEVATTGWVLSDQARWLAATYTDEGLDLAVRRTQSAAVRIWGQLVSAVPTEADLPGVLVSAMVDRMREYDTEKDYFSLAYIGRRLRESRRLDALRELASVSEDFSSVLRKPLAAAGDVDAAAELLSEVHESLLRGERVDRDDSEWLLGVADSDLLSPLFDALVAAYARGLDDPFDVTGLLISAIRRIGGDEAVRKYDTLIEGSDDPRVKFLRRARDEIVGEELRKLGRKAAPVAAASLGLPFFGRQEGTVG